MRRRGVAGSRITVHVRFSDQSRVSRSLLLPGPVAETTSLFRAAAALTHALVGERSRGRGVTLVALSMDRLRTAEYLQLEIPLGTGPADPALRAGSVQHARLRPLDGAADRARSRFGRDAVRRAALLKDHPEERSPATAIASLEEGDHR